MMRAIVTVVADIDFEAVSKQAVINLIGTKEKRQVRRRCRQLLNAAIMRIAKHQATHTCRSKMQNVETIPCPRVIGTDQLKLLGKRQRRTMNAVITQGAATDDDRRTFGGL